MTTALQGVHRLYLRQRHLYDNGNACRAAVGMSARPRHQTVGSHRAAAMGVRADRHTGPDIVRQ